MCFTKYHAACKLTDLSIPILIQKRIVHVEMLGQIDWMHSRKTVKTGGSQGPKVEPYSSNEIVFMFFKIIFNPSQDFLSNLLAKVISYSKSTVKILSYTVDFERKQCFKKIK